MALQSGNFFAKQLFNSQIGRDATNSLSNMLHRGLDKTTEKIQEGLNSVSQNIKERTSVDNISKTINKLGGRKKLSGRRSTNKKLRGGYNIIENDDRPHVNIIENNDRPHVNIIEDDDRPHVNIIENDDRPHVNIIENDDRPHVNIIENDDRPGVNVIENDDRPGVNVIEGGKRRKSKKNKTKKNKTKKN